MSSFPERHCVNVSVNMDGNVNYDDYKKPPMAYTVIIIVCGGDQCSWSSWVNIAHEFTSTRTYIQAFV